MDINILNFCYIGNITLDQNKTGLKESKKSQYKQFLEKMWEKKHYTYQ